MYKRRTIIPACMLVCALALSILAHWQVERSAPLFPVYLEKKGGYIDEHGKILIAPRFDEVGEFAEGRAAVRMGSKWGYIDQSGSIAVPPRFDVAGKFSEGLAAVFIDGKYGYIDGAGKLPIAPQFAKAGNFSEGLARVQSENGWGFVDKSGKVISLPKYDYADDFHNGLAVVAMRNEDGTCKVGYINKQGKLMFDGWFVSASRFSNGVAVISHDKAGFSTLSRGALVFDNYNSSSGAPQIVHFAVIDAEGRKVSEGDFQDVDDFSEGMAAVRLNDKYGFINKQMHVVIDAQYDLVGHFSGGLAPVHLNGQTSYINPDGKTVFSTKYSDSFLLANGMSYVRDCSDHLSPCKSGYLNRIGEIVWNPSR